jgi:hypothetical protein
MYLELLENKDKIRQEVVNKEFDPDTATIYSQPIHGDSVPAAPGMSDIEEQDDEEEEENVSYSDDEPYGGGGPSIHEEDDDVSLESSALSSPGSAEPSRGNAPALPSVSPAVLDALKAQQSTEAFDHGTNGPSSSSMPPAPRLSELQRSGVLGAEKVFPSVDRLQEETFDEDAEETEKRELLFKFELLRKSYGSSVDIPEFSVHSDFKTMKRAYESILRRVSLDSNVENYKTYLISGFMIIEFTLGHWLKFDMQGFTQQQILNMKNYERLLIELGEKSYVPGGSDWPVEVRLLGMILVNAMFFVISKLIMKKTGTNIIGILNSSSYDMRYSQGGASGNKRKMKGPSIDIEDIPGME